MYDYFTLPLNDGPPVVSLTAQQWFEHAVERSTVPLKAWNEELDQCSYQATEDLPGCFVGVSLPPDFANQLGRVGVQRLINQKWIAVEDLSSDDAKYFLGDLQTIHDHEDPKDWLVQLNNFKREWKLK